MVLCTRITEYPIRQGYGEFDANLKLNKPFKEQPLLCYCMSHIALSFVNKSYLRI
jgi:hypothetical protein